MSFLKSHVLSSMINLDKPHKLYVSYLNFFLENIYTTHLCVTSQIINSTYIFHDSLLIYNYSVRIVFHATSINLYS